MNRFPIRLVPWEELFFYKHRPSYPATFFAFFQFSQPLQRELAEEALRVVSRKHPLLRSIVHRRGTQLFWEPATPPTFHWANQPVTIEDLPHGNLDITAEPGLKIWAFDGSNSENAKDRSATIQVLIHHVAFDGLGILQILIDWLELYQELQRSGEQTWGERPIAETSLAFRCRPQLGWLESIRLLPGQWKSIRAAFEMLGRRAIALGTGAPLVEQHPRKPQVVRCQFDGDATLQLKKYAAARSAALNSVLVRDLLITINQWQRTLPEIPAGSHLRIMIPINERGAEHHTGSACNHCTMINLERRPAETENASELLVGIEQEMDVIQKWKLSLNFWRALSLFRWLPNGLRRIQNSEIAATASLTNLGRLRLTSSLAARHLDPPNSNHLLRLTNFEIVPPLLHGTMAAFAVAYLHNELKITLQYDPHHLTSEQAQELMQLYHAVLSANITTLHSEVDP
ncbi:MAG: hypothetical protein JNL67_15955 [Planctomycetaceae bacterium]|nr:hypothetical protein [Planctomycetaceae bacterium]